MIDRLDFPQLTHVGSPEQPREPLHSAEVVFPVNRGGNEELGEKWNSYIIASLVQERVANQEFPFRGSISRLTR